VQASHEVHHFVSDFEKLFKHASVAERKAFVKLCIMKLQPMETATRLSSS